MAYEAKMLLEPSSAIKCITFHELADEYLDFKKTDVQYTSYLKYEQAVKLMIKPNFPDKPINEITYSDCDIFREKVEGNWHATSYNNRLLTQFKGIFNFAIRRNYISSNPAALLKSYKKTAEELKLSKTRESNIWDYDEFSRFIDCVDDETYRGLFITLFNTGMRLGECQALIWTDFHNSSLSITKSCTKKTKKGSYEIKIPKNNSSVREIPINKSLNDYLLELKKSSQKTNPNFSENDFIFGGKKPLPQTTVERKKNVAVAKSGVKKIRIHDFRHSHATILINNGMNIVSVSKRLGHSDINMTLKTYTHLLEKRDEKMMAFLEESSHNSSQFRAPKK